MFICVVLAGSLVHWHWKASIISHLAVSKPSLPFTTSEQLLESSYQANILYRGREKNVSVETLLYRQ